MFSLRFVCLAHVTITHDALGIGPHCTAPSDPLTLDLTVQDPHPCPPAHWTSLYRLVTSGDHPLRPVKMCSLEDPLVVTSDGY